jgi:hypothetical protein
MLGTGWRASVAVLSFCLAAGGHEASAQDSGGGCAAPRPWPEADARPGRPRMELAACLRDQAYKTRNLNVTAQTTAIGLIASCQVQVDGFEGVTIPAAETGSKQDRQAADEEITRQAIALITQYRRCVGR